MVKLKKKPPEPKETAQCTRCGKIKVSTEFYISHSEVNKYTGKMPICKDCIEKLYDFYLNKYNDVKRAVREMCGLLDIYFNEVLFNAAQQQSKMQNNNTMRIYMQKVNSLKEYKGLTFDYSETIRQEVIEGKKTPKKANIDFEITKDIILKWGDTYNKEEYMRLEDFYNRMKDMNAIETPQEEEYLKKLAILSINMDKELGNGNFSNAKGLGELFSKFMADSKFRAMDKTDADKTGGIRNFSTIYQEVESDDFIPPWENYAKVLKVGQDIVDKTIMHIENFTLRLNKAERMSEPPIDTPKVDKED